MISKPPRRTILKIPLAAALTVYGYELSEKRTDVDTLHHRATALSPGEPVSTAAFGMTHLGLVNHPEPSVTYGPQRIWDCWLPDPSKQDHFGNPTWQQIHSSPASFSWDLFDRALDVLEARGRTGDLLYTFGHAPSWAQPVGSQSFLNAWRTFTEAIWERSAGRVTSWGLWNEPNDHGGDHVPNGVLAEMARGAYSILARGPSLLLSPEYIGNGAHELKEFCQNGGAPFFDIVGCHLYGNPDPDISARRGGLLAVISAYKEVMQQFGIADRPIWNTEFSEHGFSGFGGTTVDNNRDFLGQMIPLFWCLGIDRSYFYAWDGQVRPGMPVGRLWGAPDGSADPRSNAAGRAWNVMQGWLLGTLVSSPIISNRTIQIGLTKPNGYRGLIMWGCDGPADVLLPSPGLSCLKRMDGSEVMLEPSANRVSINRTPILVDNGGSTSKD